MELALTLLTVRPMSISELRLYYKLLIVRGLNVTGGWSEVEGVIKTLASQGLVKETNDGKLYIDRDILPKEARIILEENLKTILALIKSPGGA